MKSSNPQASSVQKAFGFVEVFYFKFDSLTKVGDIFHQSL